MRTEVIYSIAALATFPVVANAQVNAAKDGEAAIDLTVPEGQPQGTWTVGNLVKGKYTITSAALGADNADKKLTVKVKAGGDYLDLNGTTGNKSIVVPGKESIKITFVLEETKSVTLEIYDAFLGITKVTKLEANLNLNFNEIAKTLLADYNANYIRALWNKVTFTDKTERHDGEIFYTDLEAEIGGFASKDYQYYKDNIDDLYGLIGEETNTDLVLANTEAGKDLTKAKDEIIAREYAYLRRTVDGQGEYAVAGAETLNDKFAALDVTVGTETLDYTPEDLETKKTAANPASDPTTAEELENYKTAISDYETALESAISAKKDNEDAYSALLKRLSKVGKGSSTSDPEIVDDIKTTYQVNLDEIDKYKFEADGTTPSTRYSDLVDDAETSLKATADNAILGYNAVLAQLNAERVTKTVKKNNNTLSTEINKYAQRLTKVVTDFKADKAILDAAYKKYDDEVKALEAAKDVTDESPEALQDAKAAWEKVVGIGETIDNSSLLKYIQNNDDKNGVGNLTNDNDDYTAKLTAIETAKSSFNTLRDKYKAYFAALDDLDKQSAALADAVTAIEEHAEKKKLLKKVTEDDKVTYQVIGEIGYDPRTIWKSAIEEIELNGTSPSGQINDLKTAVNNAATSDGYTKPEDYDKDLKAIETAIENLEKNAKEATDIYADIKAQVDAANKAWAPYTVNEHAVLKQLQQLRVWNTKITINPEAEKRTPYKNFIDLTNGSIVKDNGDIANWQSVLNDAKAKTGKEVSEEDNILGYLKKQLGEKKASEVLKTDIEILTSIKANSAADESLYADQTTQDGLDASLSIINGQIASHRSKLQHLQDIIDKDLKETEAGNRTIGLLRAAKLQEELDKINGKIDAIESASKTAYNAKDADKLTEQRTAIVNLNADVHDAGVLESNYEYEYNVFKANYNPLNGTKDQADADDKNTVEGLKVYVANAKTTIDTYKAGKEYKVGNVLQYIGRLDDTLRDRQKAKVENVKTGEDANEHDIAAVNTFIKNAKETEELSDADLTKWQGIIKNLKTKINGVLNETAYLNTLEGDLYALKEAIDDAKVDVLKVDDNEEGFYYKELTGTYTNAYNSLKNVVESKEEITEVDANSDYIGSDTNKPTLHKQITDKTTEVEGNPANNVLSIAKKAEANKEAYDDAENAFSHEVGLTGDDDKGGAQERYNAANARLEDQEATNQLSVVRNSVDTQWAALQTLIDEARDAYANGECADGKKVGDVGTPYETLISGGIKKLEESIDAYLDPANYNEYVSQDNIAVHDEALQAEQEAQEAYQSAINVIATYNSFKSTELQSAKQKANAEVAALTTKLNGFNNKEKDIHTRLENEFANTQSPDRFDTEKKFKAEFEALKAEIIAATTELTSKVQSLTKTAVDESVAKYTKTANEFAKYVAKVESIDADEDLLDWNGEKWDGSAVVNALKSGKTKVDNALKAITDAQKEVNKLPELDKALFDAEKGDFTFAIDETDYNKNGITEFVETAENVSAQTVLKKIHDIPGDETEFEGRPYAAANFTPADYKEYLEIFLKIYDLKEDPNDGYATNDDEDQIAQNAKDRVANLVEYKDILKARQADIVNNALVQDAKKAINDAKDKLDEFEGKIYNDFAAASDKSVKSIFDEIRGTDPSKGIGVEVTVSNAETLKSRADKITATIDGDAADKDKDERIADIYNNLYDAEVVFINNLITKVENRLGTSDKSSTEKAGVQTRIDVQKTALGAKKDGNTEGSGVIGDVEKGNKTKKDALENDLKDIEAALHTILATDLNGSDGGINEALANTYQAILASQEAEATSIAEAYEAIIEGIDRDGDNTEDDTQYVSADLVATQGKVSGAGDDLRNFIDNHADKLDDYLENLQNLSNDLTGKINDFKKQAKEVAEKTLAGILQEQEDEIEETVALTEDVQANLIAYGNIAKFANKLDDLNSQLEKAKKILNDKKAKSSDLSLEKLNELAKDDTSLADLIIDAEDKKAYTDALSGYKNNIDEIKKLAKADYVNTAIDALKEELKAQKYITYDSTNDTWDGIWNGDDKDNYTQTDQTALSAQLSDLTDGVDEENAPVGVIARLNALANDDNVYAEDVTENSPGVKSQVSDLQKEFEDGLAALTKAVKEKRLTPIVEDRRGHVATDTDEAISTKDMNALINILLNGEEDSADKDACDINGDGVIDITDATWLRYYIVYQKWPDADKRNARQLSNGNIDKVELQVVSTANNITRVAFNLTNETVFENFQFDIVLPAGAKVVGRSLGERVENGNLLVNQNENSVRVLGISNWNKSIAGEEGAVFYLDIENLNGDLTTEQAIFTDTNLVGRNLLDGSETTGIRQKITNLIESAGERIYDLGGRISNGIKNGIKIIKKGDGTTKKVVSNK